MAITSIRSTASPGEGGEQRQDRRSFLEHVFHAPERRKLFLYSLLRIGDKNHIRKRQKSEDTWETSTELRGHPSSWPHRGVLRLQKEGGLSSAAAISPTGTNRREFARGANSGASCQAPAPLESGLECEILQGTCFINLKYFFSIFLTTPSSALGLLLVPCLV